MEFCRGDFLFKRQKTDFMWNKNGFEIQSQDSYKPDSCLEHLNTQELRGC